MWMWAPDQKARRPLDIEGSTAGKDERFYQSLDQSKEKIKTVSNLARVSERQLRTMLTTWVTVGRPVEELEYPDNTRQPRDIVQLPVERIM